MLDLRINQFRLAFDGIQWTVTRVATIQKEGATFGQERDTDHGYHGRLSHALRDVFDRLAGSEDASDVAALRRAVDTHARAIVAAAAECDRQLLAMRHAA
jgi:hypothetical protein